MKYINVVIDDFCATKLVAAKDNNMFCDWDSSKNATDNVDILTTISLIDPPKYFKDEKEDEQEESSQPKWANNDHPIDNIFSNVEGGIRTRWKMQETLNYMCFTFAIFPKNVKEVL